MTGLKQKSTEIRLRGFWISGFSNVRRFDLFFPLGNLVFETYCCSFFFFFASVVPAFSFFLCRLCLLDEEIRKKNELLVCFHRLSFQFLVVASLYALFRC